ncbi:Abi family protein [Yaniella flava]|uniref:Abi family protein n=1 Tax=Yaniella flava TaxID=287930 RepID=UPI003CD0713A
MEWALRNSVTKHYCQKFDPYGSFLDGAQYRELSREYTHEDLIKNILDNTLKHREPFVRDHLRSRADEVNGGVIPRYCDHTNFDRVKDLVSGLPLWAVVDSFSLGVLINFINMCDRGTGDDQIWKLVANDFDVRHRLLGSSLSSARTLRNMVSHHQRLWMRPTPNVPAIPKKLRQLSRRVTNNSVLAPLINISLYQGSGEERANYLHDLLGVAESDSNYWFGLAKVDNRA